MKKHIQIKNGYKIWYPSIMAKIIRRRSGVDTDNAPLIIEWWLHNIAYWLTKPFTFIPALKRINLRAKDVDLLVEVSE